MLNNLVSVIYSAEIIGFFVIGLLVLIREKSKLYKFFALFAFSLGVWQLLQFLSIQLHDNQEIATFLLRLSLVVALVTATYFYLFTLVYVKKTYQLSWIMFSVAIGSLAFFSSAIKSTPITQQGIGIPRLDVFYGLILTYGTLMIILSVRNLATYYRNSTSLKQKQQTRIMLVSAGLSGAAVVLASFYTSEFSETLLAQQIVPIALIATLFSFLYAMIYRELFDIHIFALRALAYLASYFLIVAALVYPSIILLSSALGTNFTFRQILLASLTVVAFVYFLQLIRSFFDKLTFRFFFRKYYDPQDLLDAHNAVLISNTDIESLLQKSSDVLVEFLGVSFCSFSLRDTAYQSERVLGSQDINIKPALIDEFLKKDTPDNKDQVLVVSQLEYDAGIFKKNMRDNNVACIVRLPTKIDSPDSSLGYMLLGDKNSGSNYDVRDKLILQNIANELVIAIQNALRYEEIERFNITLQEKIDEATKKLRKTNEKLEEMDQTKDEFISMASHQLRTPLTSVKGYLSMVLEGDAGEIKPMQERLLSQAFTSSQRMVYLIADLLNVSRLRTGKFVIEKIRANLADIAEGEVAQLKETAASRSLELEYQKPDNFPDLMLDETKMRQVIMNFIDNAIYYTPSAGKITVELIDKDETVELMVHDTGMGVPKADQQHLFTKFYRAGNAKKARPDGTGLGLFMAKKVIIEQGGAIIFKSKEGAGSTFGFTLPKNKLLPKTEEPQPKKEE